MTTVFTDAQREWQDHVESRALADRFEAAIVADALDEGSATVSADDELLARWPGASLVTRATVDEVFPNYGRYVHVHERVRASAYVSDGEGQAPRPSWKRLDVVQDVLPDAGRTEGEGGTITFEEYVGTVQSGTS